jgi:hypothetical protein
VVAGQERAAGLRCVPTGPVEGKARDVYQTGKRFSRLRNVPTGPVAQPVDLFWRPSGRGVKLHGVDR